MCFVLYLYGRLSVKTYHLHEIFEAIDFLNLDNCIIAQSLIESHEYHYFLETKNIVDIFVISG